METDRLAIHAQGAVAPRRTDDEAGLEHGGEYEHAFGAPDEFLRTWHLAGERRERVIHTGIQALASRRRIA